MLKNICHNRALILNAQKQSDHGCGYVVADELPAGALDWVAILGVKTVLCLEPLTDRFKGRQGVFNRASDKYTTTANKAVRRARMHAVRDFVSLFLIHFMDAELFCCHQI